MVKALTPDGLQVVVFDYAPRKRVIRSARWEEIAEGKRELRDARIALGLSRRRCLCHSPI